MPPSKRTKGLAAKSVLSHRRAVRCGSHRRTAGRHRAGLALALGALGNVRTETLREFNEGEFRKIVSSYRRPKCGPLPQGNSGRSNDNFAAPQAAILEISRAPPQPGYAVWAISAGTFP